MQVNDIMLVTAHIARYVAKEDCEGTPKSVRNWDGLPYRIALELVKMDLIARGEVTVPVPVVDVDEEGI